MEDDERPGHPLTMETDENVDRVRTLVRNDCRLSIRMIAEGLNVDKETVRQILTENLKMKNVCAKMVPKNLSKDQKLNREEKKTQTFSTVSSPAMKLGSFNTTQKPNDKQCNGKQLTLQDQKRHECQNPRSRQCSSFSLIFKELL
jgi:predicted transcriptional regulator